MFLEMTTMREKIVKNKREVARRSCKTLKIAI